MKKRYLIIVGISLSCIAFGARAPITSISNDPYTSAIVLDASTGAVLFEDGANKKVYPASVVKLMDLLLILEAVDRGNLKWESTVPVNAEASRMGGSQVYLKEGESFSLDEMLYALCIKSANDVAVALAIRVAGSTTAFVELMNQRAAELGMENTGFASVHGLPPDRGQNPDVTTARDISLLALEVLKHPRAITYTSTRERWFRNNTFQMLSHNRLLKDVPGCDGLKTGYYRAAGFSVAATATRNGRRVLAVVMGCTSRPTRDAKARELIELGFQKLPALAEPPAIERSTESRVAHNVTSGRPVEDAVSTMQKSTSEKPSGSGLQSFLKAVWKVLLVLLIIVSVLGLLILVLYSINRYRDRWKYKL